MRVLVLVVATLLAFSACDADTPSAFSGPTRPTAPLAPSAVTTAPSTPSTPSAPTPLSVHQVASQPVPTVTEGVALFGDKVAYVDGEQRLVWMSWRTGDRSTVARSQYGGLQLPDSSGRYRWLVDQRPSPEGDDPSSPRRILLLDLSTGHVRRSDYPQHAHLVGETKDKQFVLVLRGQRPDGRETWRADLVVGQRHLTSDGLVVQAAYDREHRVVWTERRSNRHPDPRGLWTADLLHPDMPPQLLLDDPDVVPFDPVVGRWFVGWSDDGQRLTLMPVGGGPVTTVPGRVAVANAPSAYGRFVAVVQTHHGRSRLVVLRVDP